MGVQEVRWKKGGTEWTADYTFYYGEGNGDHQLGTGFFIHKRTVPAYKRMEIIRDAMSHTILRGCWCNIIVLNVHTPCEDKSDDVKDSFYEELRCVFEQFLRYDIKMLLGDFDAKIGRQDIFKPTKRNETLHEISNDNGVRVVNFGTSKS
jgi:hypothetical protein